MRNFAGIDDRFAAYENAQILLQLIPYDGTSTWGKGADQGLDAFLDAAGNMELYDIETDSEVFRKGIHLLPEITEKRSPEHLFEAVYSATRKLIESGKFLSFLGGEHSVSIGIIKAFYEKYPGISVLQLDAHADLRPEYLGSPYNHACALHDASHNTNLVQVGIRSMDQSELAFMDPQKCFFARDIYQTKSWMYSVLDKLTDEVYITLDLDVFDPSAMPATGTPEPGGLGWYAVLELLRNVFEHRKVLGFDIVELAPIPGYRAAEFMVAKLYYKMLSYKFTYNEK